MSNRSYNLPKPPFNFGNGEKGIEALANLMFALFSGGECIGHEQILVSNVELQKLTPPKGTVWALIVCEKSPTNATSDEILMRFRQDKALVETDITATLGMPLCNLGVLEVKDTDNLQNFRFKGTSVDSCILNIEYYA